MVNLKSVCMCSGALRIHTRACRAPEGPRASRIASGSLSSESATAVSLGVSDTDEATTGTGPRDFALSAPGRPRYHHPLPSDLRSSCRSTSIHPRCLGLSHRQAGSPGPLYPFSVASSGSGSPGASCSGASYAEGGWVGGPCPAQTGSSFCFCPFFHTPSSTYYLSLSSFICYFFLADFNFPCSILSSF